MPGSTIGSEQISRLWEAFRSMDADSNGVISAEELSLVMQELDKQVPPSHIRELIREVDLDGSGTIDFEEFKILMVSAHGDDDARRRIAFEVLDADGTGKVDLADLEPVMRRFGLGSEELKRMIALVDRDGDGSVDFDEFVKLMPARSQQTTYKSAPLLTPTEHPEFVYDPSRFAHATVEQDAATGNEEAIARLEQLLHKQAGEWHQQKNGTSLLQLQTGLFRLIQGAAYRCFRESFSANYETHLRVRDLPYCISKFADFTELILEIYKALGVVHEDCFPVIDELKDSIAGEYRRLEERIAHWDATRKTEGMLAEVKRVEALTNESEALLQKFAAGVEYAITLRKNKLSIADAVEGVLARHELNRLRQIDLRAEISPEASPESDEDPKAYLDHWNRVIMKEQGEQISGAMMPARYWYEEFMPLLLAAVSVATPEDVRENESPDEAALDAWWEETRRSGAFDRYGADVARHFHACTVRQKLSIRRAWRLTERYLNGVQKRREREDFGRETGALSQYVAFLDVYLGRSFVRDADMRLSFPYYIGPAVWRLLHTSAEILCDMPIERQASGVTLFVRFFELFASMYPCPYCRHHLNAYVVQNREVSLYPLEYLVLGYDPTQSEFQMSATDKLRAVTTAPELRLFFWKLHNTVNASIARQEPWYQRDNRAFYTTRYWPSLDSELARARVLDHISLSTERIARIYGLLKPAARLAGLRAELQHLLENRDEDDLRRVCELGLVYVGELEAAVLDGNFLQDAYRFNPDRVDPPPTFSEKDEEFARSGVFIE